jgi:Spy/CpxP family protein refolding chaperone
MKRSLQLLSPALAMFAMLFWVSQVVAQPQPGGPGGPPGGFGGPGGPGGFGGGGILGLAMRDEVQQELQLVDEQKDKVRGIADGARDKVREEMSGIFEKVRDASDEERNALRDDIRKKFESLNADMEKELGKVLLPHQMDRLKQIDLQTKIRQRGASALTSGDLAKTLNLTDEQREKLEKRAAEVQEELQTKIRELQADARKKTIEVLTPDQQAQLQKLMGDQFDLPDQGFGGGFRGRGRGGPGNRPGDQQPPTNGKQPI